MEESNKSKMQGARPGATCSKQDDQYGVRGADGTLYGTGNTAVAAWKDAWDNFRGNDDPRPSGQAERPYRDNRRPVITQSIAAVPPPKFGGFSPEFRACQRMGTFGRVR